MEKIKPNVAANRFGGAKMNIGVNLNVLVIFFAIRANGEGAEVNALNPKSIAKKS